MSKQLTIVRDTDINDKQLTVVREWDVNGRSRIVYIGQQAAVNQKQINKRKEQVI